jgi:uncharacterized membrane protein
MKFWWIMLAFDLLIPLVMMISGWMMWKHCPKRINWFYGYRTALSMKNMDTWRFAHDYCGKSWLKMGLIMLLPSILLSIPFYHTSVARIGILGLVVNAVQLVVLFVSVYRTERALKRTFFSDGRRKPPPRSSS